MTRKTSIRLRINSERDISAALVSVTRFASDIGFEKHSASAIATAVSELTRNIIKYAQSGQVIIEHLITEIRFGIQITVHDKGPGIKDIKAAMRDHFSSSGTLGLGLPGVKRLMDDFEIDSIPGTGTSVVIRKWHGNGSFNKSRFREAANRTIRRRQFGKGRLGTLHSGDSAVDLPFDCASYVRPCIGELVSGDTVILDRRENLALVAIVDGLGHGKSANLIARRSEQYLKSSWSGDVVKTMFGLHEALSNTDGAAAGICIFDSSSATVKYAGIGNTVLRSFGSREIRLHSDAGTLGNRIRTPREQVLQLELGDVLILYTDGIKDRFEKKDYPQIRYQSASHVAKKIIEKFGKDHDDASCAVLRY